MFPQKRNKTQKGIILGGLVLFFCLLNTPSYAKFTPEITVQGTVTDAVTSQPIAGAKVTLQCIFNFLRDVTVSTTTDQSGKYKITKNLPSALYLVICQAKDYQKITPRRYFLIQTKSYTYNFALVRTEVATIAPPQIKDITPKDGLTFEEGDKITITCTTDDLKSSNLEYQFSVDGVIQGGWQKQSSYTWSGIPGRHDIKVELKNIAGQDTKSVEVYVFRKPIPVPDP